MQDNINKSHKVNVNNLHFTTNKCFAVLKESEISKIKAYCCVVESVQKID